MPSADWLLLPQPQRGFDRAHRQVAAAEVPTLEQAVREASSPAAAMLEPSCASATRVVARVLAAWSCPVHAVPRTGQSYRGPPALGQAPLQLQALQVPCQVGICLSSGPHRSLQRG